MAENLLNRCKQDIPFVMARMESAAQRVRTAHNQMGDDSVPHISIQNLTVRYKTKGMGVLALEKASMEVPARSFISIVGPSGCGKTTLLKVLSGVLPPSSGNVTLNGRNFNASEVVGKIGHVFQRPLLLPWRSAIENVALTNEIVRPDMSRQDRIAEARKWLEVTGLSGFEDRMPHELSGGMQQRVSLSRALAFKPQILLMDEPFAALDEITRETLQEELLRVWEAVKCTVIFITHSISEAMLLSERVVVMTARPGQIDEIIEVPFSHPRGEQLRADARFTELSQYIRHKLRAAKAGT